MQVSLVPLVYRKPVRIDQYLHYSSHNQTNCAESGFSTINVTKIHYTHKIMKIKIIKNIQTSTNT